MPKVIVDVTNVPDSDYQTYDGPTPRKGLYKALFNKAWWTKTKDGKKTMVKVLFLLDTDNESKKQFNGYPVWHNVTYEASTMWKMKELFTALNAGAKAAIDYEGEKGEISRIGRAIPGKTWLLIHGVDGSWKGQPRLEVDTLAPLPGVKDEDDAADEWADADGDATPFEDAGGVVVSATDDGDAVSMGGAPAEDPWAAPSGSASSDGGSVAPVDDEPPF